MQNVPIHITHPLTNLDHWNVVRTRRTRLRSPAFAVSFLQHDIGPGKRAWRNGRRYGLKHR